MHGGVAENTMPLSYSSQPPGINNISDAKVAKISTLETSELMSFQECPDHLHVQLPTDAIRRSEYSTTPVKVASFTSIMGVFHVSTVVLVWRKNIDLALNSDRMTTILFIVTFLQ